MFFRLLFVLGSWPDTLDIMLDGGSDVNSTTEELVLKIYSEIRSRRKVNVLNRVFNCSCSIINYKSNLSIT